MPQSVSPISQRDSSSARHDGAMAAAAARPLEGWPAGIRRGLLADTVSVAYGERPCSSRCSEDLARRLEASGDIGGLCSAALRGAAAPPPPHFSWVALLRSHLPLWGLLRRAGLRTPGAGAEVEEDLAQLWFQMLPSMRAAASRGWRSGVALAFSRVVKKIRQWPSLLLQAEMLLQVANALRYGVIVFHTLDRRVLEAAPSVVLRAADYFIDQGQRLFLNVTGGLQYTERLMALLAQNELLRATSFDILADFLPKDPVVVFGGAHAGAVLSTVLDVLPGSKAYAFEADPFVFRVLQANLGNNPRVVLKRAALYNRGGVKLKLLTRDGVGSQSTLFAPTFLFNETWPWVDWGSTAEVTTLALEPWARLAGVTAVDFVYLDVECAELAALQGMRGLLQNVTAVHLEVSTEPLCDQGPLWPEVERFLHSRGFRMLAAPPKPWAVRTDVTFLRLPLPMWAREPSGNPASGGAARAGTWSWDAG